MYPTIKLKPGRGNPRVTRHPWIFSGAVADKPAGIDHGDIVRVVADDDELVGTGFYSAKSMIAVRLVEFDDVEMNREWLRRAITEANRRRELLGLTAVEGGEPGYRVVFGESDWLPGLVVDRYGHVLVMQFSTAGMERLREDTLAVLTELFAPKTIFERSDSPSRAEEGLSARVERASGEAVDRTPFREGGVVFEADIAEGQKTGFFLDQRRLREWVVRFASGRRVADLFSYSGASGICALAHGASGAVFVDSSARALDGVRRHLEVNSLSPDSTELVEEDVFQWLGARSAPEFDMVILDPPALIKSRKHAESGRKGYHFLNRAALRLINDGGLLISSSCSTHFSEDDLRVTLRRAADQAGVRLHVLAELSQSEDHPVSVYFPEARYLKSLICQVERTGSGESAA